MTTAADVFTRTYADRAYRFPALVRHAGTVIALAMDADRRIRYSVLDLARAGGLDANGWGADPAVLGFASEIAAVGFGIGDQVAMPRVRTGSRTPVAAGDPVRPDELDAFLSSTARLTAAAPFQVLSDGRYVYVIRQAIVDPEPAVLEAARHTLVDPAAGATATTRAADLVADHDAMVYVTDGGGEPVLDAHGRVVPVVRGTLLVDRFVLVGTSLVAKRDVRFQRSRSHTPASSTDTLGASDLEDRLFLEPTQDLRFVSTVRNGAFAVALVPTAVADVSRWQVFTATADVVWVHGVARTKDGLFDTQGAGALTCPDHPDIFAVEPGTCPRPALADPSIVCGKTLVPQVDTGGGSGTALAFAADAPGVLTIDGGGVTGREFTVEAWLRTDPAGTGERILLGGDPDGDKGASPPSIWIVDGTTVRAGFGDGTALQQTTVGPVLTPGRWQHLAVSFGAGVLSVYVDGVLRSAAPTAAGTAPTAAAVTRVGGGPRAFAGALDELRIWAVARTGAEIDTGRHRRLVGIEGGLVGYWRLDEGAGFTTFDQATSARAQLDGPSWVGSDAPVADPVGLTRNALRPSGRTVTGGLAATVYHQQETAVTGYDTGAARLLKQAARLLLTLVTSADDDPGPAHVTALDLGVAADGTLAQPPAEISFATLTVDGTLPGADGDALSGLVTAQAQLSALTADVTASATHVAALRGALDAIAAVQAGKPVGPVPPEIPGLAQQLGSISRLRARLADLAQAGGAERAQLEFARNGVRDLITDQVDRLTSRQQQLEGDLKASAPALATQQAALAAAEDVVADLQRVLDGDTALPMPLLHLDTRGLSVTGAVLGFAPTPAGTDAASLLDGALGRVTLYFRAPDGQLLLAYYDTMTGRARSTLSAGADPGGLVTFVTRSTEGELDDVAVAVSAGASADTCTVAITATAAQVTETWPEMPRDAETLADVLNGSGPAPVVVARAGAVPAGKLDALPVPDGTLLPLPGGALLQVEGTVVRTTAYAARGATGIPIQPIELELPAGAFVARIGYDTGRASSTRTGADLRRGSLLVAADPRAATGPVGDGTSTSLGPTSACRWFASPPGSTLAFDGKATRAGVLARTATTFDGSADGAVLATADVLDITGDVTLEAWIRPTALDGIRDIVVHGPRPGPDGQVREVYLRVINGQYQAGSYDGQDHVARWPVPPTDTGTWIHLAGVYGNGRWQLFRNGVLVAAQDDPTGAVAVPGGWSIGCGAAGATGHDRFLAGDVDEVRIWSRALDQTELTDGLGRRLAGTEAGLAAYVRSGDGVLADHTSHATAVTVVGSPQATTSPPALARLSGFDVRGDVTVETWVRPASTDDVSRIVVHRSADSAYGLALHKSRTALHLDGTAGRIVLPDAPALRITGRITIEAWVRSTSLTGLQDIVARGPVMNPAGEVVLRRNGPTFEIGRWTNTPSVDRAAGALVPGNLGTWTHLAGVYDGASWRLYANGVEVAASPDATGAVPVSAPWTIGGAIGGDRVFAGDIDEVRIWNVARTADQIRATMRQTATGTEPGLVAVWRVDGGQVRDFSPRHLDAVPAAVPAAATAVAGPLAPSAYTAIVEVGVGVERTVPTIVETVPTIPVGEWSHVAAAFRQRYGIALADGAHLDAGDDTTLSLSRDLTIEVGLRLDATGVTGGLISRGTLADGTDDDVPYAFALDEKGLLTFTFEDTAHALHPFRSTAPAVTDTGFHRVAVTRAHRVSVDTSAAKQPGGATIVDAWDDITFYVDGRPLGPAQQYRGAAPGSSAMPTLIGRVLGPGTATTALTGRLSEVRLWNAAREAGTIGRPIKGTETGLVAWWTLADGTGNRAGDAKSHQDATLRGGATWVPTPDGEASTLVVHLDGRPVATTPVPPSSLPVPEPQFTVGARVDAIPADHLGGTLEELRIWRVARTTEQIQDNLFGRVTESAGDLVAGYRFEAGSVVPDHGLRGNDLAVTRGAYVLSTAPVGDDAPITRNAVLGLASRFQTRVGATPSVAEYAELQNAGGAVSGLLKRVYATVDPTGRWQLLTGFKVGDLATEWVGQVQFDPQLVGYLEGAPPVPSENLTVADDYGGATSVALTEATATTYTYGTTRDSGFNATFEAGASLGVGVQTFLGEMVIAAPLGIGGGSLFLHTAANAEVTATAKASFETALSWLSETESGQGTTRTTVSSLGLTGRKESTPAHPGVGARYVPANVGIALVQSQTADVYALRLLHTGTLVAYQMRPNPDIPRDWNLIPFPIDPRYVKQGVLDGHVGNDADVDYPNALTYSPDLSYFKPIEAYALKNRIDRDEEELATLFHQHDVDPNQLAGGKLPPTVLPIKRNLVNSYVWTADGGQFAETTAVLDTYNEKIGGSYHFQGLGGYSIHGEADVFGATVGVDFSAMFGGHLDLSVTKTRDAQRSFQVDVTVGGEQDIADTRPDGTGVKRPGKVDAYRWMTYYLAPDPAHHDLFFRRVVDPIWLATSADPAAAALRQAQQDAKSPAAWRVLHRVTYVSRVLAAIGDAAPPLDRALAALDLASNYELVRTLEPYVRSHAGRYVDFVGAVRSAVAMHLPELLPHVDDVVRFLVLYYGVTDAPQLKP